jgi:hypothetical protein
MLLTSCTPFDKLRVTAFTQSPSQSIIQKKRKPKFPFAEYAIFVINNNYLHHDSITLFVPYCAFRVDSIFSRHAFSHSYIANHLTITLRHSTVESYTLGFTEEKEIFVDCI